MSKDQKISLYIFVAVVFLLICKLYLLYFPINFYGYLVPPGEDPVNHLLIINQILAGHWSFTYPPLFHGLIAFFSNLFSIDPMQLMKVVTPALVVLPAIAVYFFLSKNVSRLAGFAGFFICLIASNYGLVAYVDGNYPNILAAGFFMPIALGFIALSFKKNTKANLVYGAIFMLLMILTHHLTTAIFLTIMIAYLIVIAIWRRFDKSAPKLGKIAFVLLGLLILAVTLIATTGLKEVFLDAYRNFSLTGSVNGVTTFLQVPAYSDYADSTGQLAFYFGILGMAYLVSMLRRPNEEVNKPMIVLLLCWFAVTYLLSRTFFVGLPARIARETALPLIMAAAIFIDDVIRHRPSITEKTLLLGFLGYFIVTSMTQIYAGPFQAPDFYSKMVLFWPGDKEKTDYINTLVTSDSQVLVNPMSPYLSYFSDGRVYTPSKYMQSQQDFIQVINSGHASYVLVMNTNHPNPFPEIVDRDERMKKQLTDYCTKNKYKVIYSFADGSKVYKVK